MSLISTIFHTILYQPLFNALVLIYEYLPGKDFGLSIIVLTLVIRFILYPLAVKSIKSQRAINRNQPKEKALQEKYKNDKERQAKEMMALWKEEKVNPFGGLFLVLIQLPILIAIYQVFRFGFQKEQLVWLYHFLPSPGEINPFFLGLVNLSLPNVVLSIIAGITQFIQAKMMTRRMPQSTKSDASSMIQKQMIYFFPIFTALIMMRFASAISLYWAVSNIFSIVQEYFISKKEIKAKELKTS